MITVDLITVDYKANVGEIGVSEADVDVDVVVFKSRDAAAKVA